MFYSLDHAYYKTNNTIIYCEDVLSALKKLPDESIDCVITSPPYWALRDYQLEPQIWDGDEKCEHEFPNDNIKRIRGDVKNFTNKPIVGSNANEYQSPIQNNGSFCSLCSAWRGSVGSEPTFELYLKHLLQIFDEIKRVLKKTGTCWVNLGDSYAGSGNGTNDYRTEESKSLSGKRFDYNMMFQGKQKKSDYPDKSLCLIPQRFAIGMVDRGWILRNQIIWYKRNCMPSSVKDRFTVDYEPIFFFSKTNETNYWVNEKTGLVVDKQPKGTHGIEGTDWEWRDCPRCQGKSCDRQKNKRCINGKVKYSFWSGRDYWFEQQYEPYSPITLEDGRIVRIQAGQKLKHTRWKSYKENKIQEPSEVRDRIMAGIKQGRNRRCVWDITTKGFSGAHFAVFPETLVEPMIKSGCPEFICKKCGKAREKIYKLIEKKNLNTKQVNGKNTQFISKGQHRLTEKGTTPHFEKDIKKEIGYADCGCNAGWTSGIVLDPFCGSGTTGVVAQKLGRKFIGIELNQNYVDKICIPRLEKTREEVRSLF